MAEGEYWTKRRKMERGKAQRIGRGGRTEHVEKRGNPWRSVPPVRTGSTQTSQTLAHVLVLFLVPVLRKNACRWFNYTAEGKNSRWNSTKAFRC